MLILSKTLPVALELVDCKNYWQFQVVCDQHAEQSQVEPWLSPRWKKTLAPQELMAQLLQALQAEFRHCPRCDHWVSVNKRWHPSHQLCLTCVAQLNQGHPLLHLGQQHPGLQRMQWLQSLLIKPASQAS